MRVRNAIVRLPSLVRSGGHNAATYLSHITYGRTVQLHADVIG